MARAATMLWLASSCALIVATRGQPTGTYEGDCTIETCSG